MPTGYNYAVACRASFFFLRGAHGGALPAAYSSNRNCDIFSVELDNVADHISLVQLLDAIEDEVLQGGYLIDWHACDLFPKSWIDLVVVLRCPSTSLHYDRLASRYRISFAITDAQSILSVLDLGVTTTRNYKRTSMRRSSGSCSKRPARRSTKRLWWN